MGKSKDSIIEKIPEIIYLVKENGYTQSDLSRKYEISKSTISDLFNKKYNYHVKFEYFGCSLDDLKKSLKENNKNYLRTRSKNQTGKLTDDDILNIFDLYRKGCSLNEIGQKYNLSKQFISKITRGEVYKYQLEKLNLKG